MPLKSRSLLLLAGIVLVICGIALSHMKRSPSGAAEATSGTEIGGDIASQTLSFFDETEEYDIYDNIRSYLIIGTDHSGDEDETGGEYVGSMADFLMLAVFDKTKGTWGLLEINRDTVTTVRLIDENGEGEATSEMQICTAHWYGGSKKMSCLNTVEAVSGLLGGLRVDGYYSIGMDHIREINHAVGGVTVTIEDDFSDSDPSLKEGETITLTDDQAYNYLHARMDVGDGTNESRMRRQETYLTALLEKMQSEMSQNPSVFSSKYRELEAWCVTNLTGEDVSNMQDILEKGSSLGILKPEGESRLGQLLEDGLDHAEFYVDEDSLIDCLTTLCGLTKVE